MKYNKNRHTTVMRYAGLGVQWFVLLGASVWGGMKLDEKTGWSFPMLTVCLPLLALGISLWQLIRELGKPDKGTS
jgi:hypothetical protein